MYAGKYKERQALKSTLPHKLRTVVQYLLYLLSRTTDFSWIWRKWCLSGRFAFTMYVCSPGLGGLQKEPASGSRKKPVPVPLPLVLLSIFEFVFPGFEDEYQIPPYENPHREKKCAPTRRDHHGIAIEPRLPVFLFENGEENKNHPGGSNGQAPQHRCN